VVGIHPCWLTVGIQVRWGLIHHLTPGEKAGQVGQVGNVGTQPAVVVAAGRQAAGGRNQAGRQAGQAGGGAGRQNQVVGRQVAGEW